MIGGVSAEPTIEEIRKIVKTLEQDQPDEVVAIGGGSVMDAAKAAWLSYQAKTDVTELFGANVISKRFPTKQFKRIIAVPTTAGTGSEVTQYSNISDPDANLKYVISEEQIIPKMALINPDYCLSMSKELTVSTALDALTHLIEALLNTTSPSVEKCNDDWILRAISMILKSLPDAINDPHNSSTRERLSAAATIGGMAIAARPTGLPHLASYSFYRKLPHGLSVALLLPPFWRFYLQNPTVVNQTLKLANFLPYCKDTGNPEEIISTIEKFIYTASGINGLKALPFYNQDMIKQIATDATKNPIKLKSAPQAIQIETATQTISEILRNTLP